MMNQGQMMGCASWWIGSGRAASRKKTLPSISGSKRWLPAMNCASGSSMIRQNLSSFASATKQNYAHLSNRQHWQNSISLRVRDHLRSSLLQKIANTITPVSCAMFWRELTSNNIIDSLQMFPGRQLLPRPPCLPAVHDSIKGYHADRIDDAFEERQSERRGQSPVRRA